MSYAQDTSVSVERSRIEIERTLKKYGATAFVYATQETKAAIQFEMRGRRIRFILELPDINEKRFAYTPGRNNRRTTEAQEREWEQACRSRWRALLLVIKAKLEAIEIGISLFEQEFMANIMLPDGGTVGEFMIPQIDVAYKTGTMPAMLPMLAEGK